MNETQRLKARKAGDKNGEGKNPRFSARRAEKRIGVSPRAKSRARFAGACARDAAAATRVRVRQRRPTRVAATRVGSSASAIRRARLRRGLRALRCAGKRVG